MDMMLWDIESELQAQGYKAICGVDEAGRGPLAGPVAAAAVILPFGTEIHGLGDSKKLTEKKREVLYDKITDIALAYSIALASCEEVDSLNVLQATFLAMNRAIAGLAVRPDIAVIDGNQNIGIECFSKCVVRGDSISPSIAAASILAKVTRDRHMLKMAERFPEYGFEKHKGYGTKLHYEMIQKHGVSEIHRRSFLRKVL